MGKVGNFSSAVGAFVLAAAISVYASAWADLIRPHPHFVALFLMLGIVLLLWPLFYRVGSFASGLADNPSVPLNVVSEPIQDMQIELIEHGELSSELLLECVN